MVGAAQGDRARPDARGGIAGFQAGFRQRPVGCHPGSCAIVRGGIEADRCPRRGRDRARSGCLRGQPQGWPDHHNKRADIGASRADHHTCGSPPTAGDLLESLLRRQRRPHLVRPRSGRLVPPRGRLRRSHPQGREAGRSAGAGADQIRAGHQSQDRQGAWPRSAADAARPRRRGDRVSNRRDFITLLGAAAAWPLAARAQQAAMPVIGFLFSSAPTRYLTAFRQGLREAGYVEGQNVAIEYRWAHDQHDRLPDLAADLVRRQVTVIAAHDTPSAIVAKAATTTIPIVYTGGADPVKLGLVASLNRPGGNVTGVTFVAAELGAKQLGLLHELQPGAVRVGVLVDPNYAPTQSFVSDVQAAASSIRKQIEVLEAPTGRDIDTAFASLAQKPIDALLVGPSPLLNNRRVQVVTLAAYHRVPAIYSWREAAEVGGLMSYGTSITDANRQAGVYAGRILKGEKPADLPVMQSIKFEFVINLNTARAFGLGLSPGLLAIPDEVIE